MSTLPASLVLEEPTTIAPSHGWSRLRLGDLWEYRELIYFLTWRDVKIRYKQTALGVVWVVLQPLMTMVVFTIFFGRLGRMPSAGSAPYAISTLCALIPWQLFAYALSESSNSLVSNERLITKVYFPRLVVPLAAVLAGLVDFTVAFVLLAAGMVMYGVSPTPAIVLLPLFTVLAVAAALGVGLWLSALNVQYRDVRYTLGFLTQFWLLATPVAYPSSIVPPQWRAWLGLNPMAGVVEGFRWALLSTPPPDPWMLAVSSSVTVALLVSGAFYFRRMERQFVDVI